MSCCKIVYTTEEAQNSEWFMEKMMLAQAQEARITLDEEQLAFLADTEERVDSGPDAQALTTTAIFQMDDIDAFDSDCDELTTAKNKSEVVQDTTSPEQQDAMIMSVIEEMSNQVAKCNAANQENKTVNESLTTKKHDALSVIDSEETLELAEATRLRTNEKQNHPIVKEKRVNITPIGYTTLNKVFEHFVSHFVLKK
ncbi:hypothetical protein Tco_0396588 [Tanacetum coccineum]